MRRAAAAKGSNVADLSPDLSFGRGGGRPAAAAFGAREQVGRFQRDILYQRVRRSDLANVAAADGHFQRLWVAGAQLELMAIGWRHFFDWKGGVEGRCLYVRVGLIVRGITKQPRKNKTFKEDAV